MEGLVFPHLQTLLESVTYLNLKLEDDEGQVSGELRKWERMLEEISLVLENAKEKQIAYQNRNPSVIFLRDLAYDIEDILDEFNTEFRQWKLEAQSLPSKSPSKVRKLIPACCVGPDPSPIDQFNAEMISKIKSITSRLEEIEENQSMLIHDLLEVPGSQVTASPTSSLLSAGEVYGREKDKQAILGLLKAKASNNTRISVIPIVGMGGVGKTTLARLIYNDDTLLFDYKAWVFVGKDFNMHRMTETLLQEAGPNDLTSLHVKLKEKLSGKKFLIVLDDVWATRYSDWDAFRALFQYGVPGSILILTTRSQHVSSMMGTTQAYTVKELSYEDCLSVFAQHALGEANFDKHLSLEEMGKGIVERCQGLPLAAKAFGSLLRGEPNANVWQEALNREIWDLQECDVIPDLMLSYSQLPSDLKRCFAYCAIFPKGYEFDRKELILLWRAEGFLRKESIMEHLGYRNFDDLLSSSFFQPSASNKSLYVMHNLIHDLARFVSGETCLQLGDTVKDAESFANVRHSSFLCHEYDIPQRFKIIYEMKSLRTFLALPISASEHFHSLASEVLHELVPKLKCLRTLSLSGYRLVELPNSVGTLKNLSYLNLSRTAIDKLPKSVCELINLQTLILCGCRKLVQLPKDIQKLINLEHLDITDTVSLQEMPIEVGSLTKLFMLPKFIVSKGNGVGINKLKNFPDLEGKLCILGLQNVVDIEDAVVANLKEKCWLDELELEWIDDFSVSRKVDDEFQVLTRLQPHPYLTSLEVISFGGMKLPPWIADLRFSHMVQLKFRNCRRVKSLPPLGRLPSLKVLSMEGMDELKEIGVEFYEDSSCFACLETLIIKNMLEWEQWSWYDGLHEAGAEQFPNLCRLEIVCCPKLIGKLPSCLPSLESLMVWNCPQLVDSPKILPSITRFSAESCPGTILTNEFYVNSLISLKISNILGLVSFPEALIQALVALEEFTISNCGELAYLWQDGTNLDYLTRLKSLEIENCKELVCLVEGEEAILPCNLQVLGISHCRNIEKLPNELHYLESLKVLKIYRCYKLYSTQLLESLSYRFPHLTELEISHCPEFLERGLSIPSLVSLKFWFSENLRSLLKQMEGLKSLQKLNISCCPELESFPGNGLPICTLTHLRISSCEKLRSLPSQMLFFTSLQFLEIDDCESLLSFPECGLPLNLTELSFHNCKNFRQRMPKWGLHSLTSLRKLRISGPNPSVDMIECFPDDDGQLLPSSLTHIYIYEFENLESISRGLKSLTSLQTLYIDGCPKLQSLPKEGLPATLKYFGVSSCPLLKSQYLQHEEYIHSIIAKIPRVEIN